MVEVKRVRGRAKRRLVMFDKLTKQEQRETCSVWQGEKGVYIFENTNEVEVRKPIRKVYLNRTYFTGLFRSRKSGEYLGDIKEPEGKKYLLFRVIGETQLEILEKVSVA
jgi:hypothetical protein